MEQYRKTPRACFLSYDEGDFFITICIRDRKHHFGEIENNVMHYSETGRFCFSELEKASQYNPRIKIPVFTVMPNHIHFIIHLEKDDMEEENIEQRNPNPSLRPKIDSKRKVALLSKYVSSLKGSVTKFAKAKGIDLKWQGRYHDHYIRGPHDGNNISEYIVNNVYRWDSDCFK